MFVVRIYDGTHIGKKRYDAMREAVESALNQAKANSITGVHDYLWKETRLM